jgi:hypothetical protein
MKLKKKNYYKNEKQKLKSISQTRDPDYKTMIT